MMLISAAGQRRQRAVHCLPERRRRLPSPRSPRAATAERCGSACARRRSMAFESLRTPQSGEIISQRDHFKLLQQLVEVIEARVVHDQLAAPLARGLISTVVPRRSDTSSSRRARSRSRRLAPRRRRRRAAAAAPAPRSRAPTGLSRRRACASSICRAPSSASSARAWPMSSAPSISMSCTGRAQLEQAQQVGGRAARAADRVGRLLVRHARIRRSGAARPPLPPSD